MLDDTASASKKAQQNQTLLPKSETFYSWSRLRMQQNILHWHWDIQIL
jgi:hypothetical protein